MGGEYILPALGDLDFYMGFMSSQRQLMQVCRKYNSKCLLTWELMQSEGIFGTGDFLIFLSRQYKKRDIVSGIFGKEKRKPV